jgi:hypothetical protein
MLSVSPETPVSTEEPEIEDVASDATPRALSARAHSGPHPHLRSQAARRRALRLSTPACLGISLALVALTMAVGALGARWEVVGVVWMAAVVVFVVTGAVAMARAFGGAVALVRIARGQSGADTERTLLAFLGNLVMATLGMLVAYVSTVGFARGRQLRRFGRVLLPNLNASTSWATMPPVVQNHAPEGVADQWRENGKTEHASVAAFARLTLDLMALGAPPELLAAGNRDALDEIRHTELCFSLASALDGKAASPGPFPEARRAATLPAARPLALATLAVDSLVDGALHEGVSARIVARLAERCGDPAIRGTLKEIAADEGRHSAHGWAVVDWCLREGGRPVAHALFGALEALPAEMDTQLPLEARSGAWECWGIHGEALERREYAKARVHVIERVHALASRASRAA